MAFNIEINKDAIRRILARHYRPGRDSGGPSWLTFLGHMSDRHAATRIFGSPVVLDDGGPRKQTARVQGLLQQPSHAYLTGRANTGNARVTTHRQSPFVSMATQLSMLISNTHGCVIFQRLALAAISRLTSANFPRNHSVSLSKRASRIRSCHCSRIRSEC